MGGLYEADEGEVLGSDRVSLNMEYPGIAVRDLIFWLRWDELGDSMDL